jgi:hypothetical protein
VRHDGRRRHLHALSPETPLTGRAAGLGLRRFDAREGYQLGRTGWVPEHLAPLSALVAGVIGLAPRRFAMTEVSKKAIGRLATAWVKEATRLRGHGQCACPCGQPIKPRAYRMGTISCATVVAWWYASGHSAERRPKCWRRLAGRSRLPARALGWTGSDPKSRTRLIRGRSSSPNFRLDPSPDRNRDRARGR